MFRGLGSRPCRLCGITHDPAWRDPASMEQTHEYAELRYAANELAEMHWQQWKSAICWCGDASCVGKVREISIDDVRDDLGLPPLDPTMRREWIRDRRDAGYKEWKARARREWVAQNPDTGKGRVW